MPYVCIILYHYLGTTKVGGRWRRRQLTSAAVTVNTITGDQYHCTLVPPRPYVPQRLKQNIGRKKKRSYRGRNKNNNNKRGAGGRAGSTGAVTKGSRGIFYVPGTAGCVGTQNGSTSRSMHLYPCRTYRISSTSEAKPCPWTRYSYSRSFSEFPKLSCGHDAGKKFDHDDKAISVVDARF